MASIRVAIEELERAVRETTSEHMLHLALDRGLGTLRRRYRRDPAGFGDHEIARLQQLRQVWVHVSRSMELMERAPYVQNAADYESLQRDLRELAARLAALPVGQTIIKELQGLPVQLPAIQAAENIRQEARQSRFVGELEASAERCPEGHMMEIRHGSRGPFWGCCEYPKCRATRDLKSEQLTLLNSP
jgi:hypothetical protein